MHASHPCTGTWRRASDEMCGVGAMHLSIPPHFRGTRAKDEESLLQAAEVAARHHESVEWSRQKPPRDTCTVGETQVMSHLQALEIHHMVMDPL